MTRQFTDSPAVRSQVPLLVGLCGPSGSGKTFSALRLAKGVQSVSGGDIFVVDTEANRALHYADHFKFRHVPFTDPFGALDYLEVLRHCRSKGAGVIVVDSMSHEHEGPGGLLDSQEKELDRIAGNDWNKRERCKFLAWAKPKAARRALINGLLQMNANFVFCFRAKQTVKMAKKPDGKSEFVAQGFMPIAGEEFVFEMTVNCLLMPHSDGVPSWQSDNHGERMAMKLPVQFRDIFAKERPLSEDIGRQLAEWARGGAPAGGPPAGPADALEAGRAAAKKGSEALRKWWAGLAGPEKRTLKSALDGELKQLAEEADERFINTPPEEVLANLK